MSERAGERAATALRVAAAASAPDAFASVLSVAAQRPPAIAAGTALIEVKNAAVNPSDAKAVLGMMPQAVWPRTPGRDYAGVVVEGPSEWIGKSVWGTGGDLGIRRDGSHARYLCVDVAALREKPRTLSFAAAGFVGVPFVTAAHGFQEAGGIKPSDIVAVFGANGKVGEAAMQIAQAAGARIFGIVRNAQGLERVRVQGPEIVDAATVDAVGHLREKTDGHGVDIAYNTVGSPYFAMANKLLAHRGRQLFISTIDRAVPFDIFAFYRGRHRFVGVDSLALSHVECGALLETLRAGFECGDLKPFAIGGPAHSLRDAAEAYRNVLGGALDRVVVDPSL